MEGWRNVMYLGWRLGDRLVAVLAPSWIQGHPSLETAHRFGKLFQRPFDLEYRGFQLSVPFVSLRLEYGKLVEACAHRLFPFPTSYTLTTELGAI